MKISFKKIAIVPNAFKGTLTASQAAMCIERGLRRALPEATFVKIPVADGGEGTTKAIMAATKGRWVTQLVTDPLGRPVQAGFVLTGDRRTAVVEMASASGLVLLKSGERNPLITSSRGTGELIHAALSHKISRLIIGIGGSATNDGGMGLARALGVTFFDTRGRELADGGGSLINLARIDCGNLDPRLRSIKIAVASDVNNPLYGPLGAAHVYSPQKGATHAMVNQLDLGLKRFAKIIKRDLKLEVAQLQGAGAAGGVGAGIVALLGGKICSGADLVMKTIDLETKLAGCDLVITGEGRLDAQTAFGKAPIGVARVARRLHMPVIAICGSLGSNQRKLESFGINAAFSALEEPMSESALVARAPKMLEKCAEQIGRLLQLGALHRINSIRRQHRNKNKSK